MEKLEQVQVILKANIYYDGRVTSRTVMMEDGERKTLGFMMAGEYTFKTGKPEEMYILGGEILVTMEGEEEKRYREGETFRVPGESSFRAVVKQYADYCCTYGK